MATFVLDTNVLLFDYDVFSYFSNSNIILGFVVLEELDKLKREQGIRGYMARKVSKKIEELVDGANLKEGVKIVNNNTIKLVSVSELSDTTDYNLDLSIPDNKLLYITLSIQRQNPTEEVVFVSKDTNARLKARGLGLTALDFPFEQTNTDLYTGYSTITVSPDLIKQLYLSGILKLKEIESYLQQPLIENQFLILKSMSDSISGLAFYSDNQIHLLKYKFDTEHKNKEQLFALHLLHNNSIPIVSLTGPSGTGKTYLSLSTSLSKINKKYKKILILKPVIPIGRDIGYLPGDVNEKLYPYLQSYFDNLELLVKDYDYLLETGTLEIQAITYIRGRSLNNSFIIVDETENIEPNIIKTIMSRVGFNSKIVFLGDTDQIDNYHLSKDSNGLTYLITQLKGNKYYGHVALHETIRSKVSEIAVKYL